MKEYWSTITIKFDGNNLEAESEEDYIQKIKDQFYEDFNVNLENDEIKIHGSKDKKDRFLELENQAIDAFLDEYMGTWHEDVINPHLDEDERKEFYQLLEELNI